MEGNPSARPDVPWNGREESAVINLEAGVLEISNQTGHVGQVRNQQGQDNRSH
jgi:hypothetical protein